MTEKEFVEFISDEMNDSEAIIILNKIQKIDAASELAHLLIFWNIILVSIFPSIEFRWKQRIMQVLKKQ